MAYVGASAFSHKGGLHVSAVKKDPKTYEHINPELIGNHRNIIVSNQVEDQIYYQDLKNME